jgi:uncharacterized protein YqeY
MVLDTIKAASLTARKARETEKAALLSTLLGEIETLAKSGRGEINDAVVMTVIKKFIKNTNEMISLLPDSAESSLAQAMSEKAVLESFLPKQLTEEELGMLIDSFISSGAKDVGDAMKLLKTHHAGTYDGAVASKLLKARFAI